MHFSKFLPSVLPLLFAHSTIALPTGDSGIAAIEERATCAATCGTVCYQNTTITAAVTEGYKDFKADKTEGSSTYPHTYNNYEGFTFPVSGPYQEFPIMSSFKVYSGGEPGADRVIFNTKGQFAHVITHTGASGDNFVACTP